MSIGLFEAFQIQLQVEYQNIINAQLGCSSMGLEHANKDLQTYFCVCSATSSLFLWFPTSGNCAYLLA